MTAYQKIETPVAKWLADALTDALAENPVEAVAIISACVESIRLEMPVPAFAGIEQEAQSWASLATPLELVAYSKAIAARLTGTALAIDARKRLLAAVWLSMPDEAKTSFLAWAGREGGAA